MFSKKDPVRDLCRIMDRETELLNTYFAEEKELFAAVTSRDWNNLENSIRRMEETGESIAALEEKRETALTVLRGIHNADDRERFYFFLQKLPEETRSVLAESFRSMKVAVLRLQALDNQIQGYLRSAATTLKEIVEEIFPHRKGTMYCKKGKTSEPEANPMFISRHL
jgi:AcrR family transcriptional regulator